MRGEDSGNGNVMGGIPSVKHANINEIFGPTIQGEGVHTGQRVGFLRFAGCNLTCVWCDTPYSWDWERFDRNEESHRMSLPDIASQIEPMNVRRLVVTGGEPMLQQNVLPELYRLTNCLLDIETNGTIKPKPEVIDVVDMFCVSPKLAHGGDSEESRETPALHDYAQLAQANKAMFKFVCQWESDLDEVDRIIAKYDIPRHSVWIMGEGILADAHLESMRRIADESIARGFNVTSRIHLLIWKQERGH